VRRLDLEPALDMPFQAHVSLAKVLEIHETGVDYRAVFDHFDDLALLNGSNNPDEVEFFRSKVSSRSAANCRSRRFAGTFAWHDVSCRRS